MFIFNPKIAVRNLLKYRSTTAISLLGFVIGLTSVIFLYFYLENELNYDSFHSDKDKIYRVIRISTDNTGDPMPIAPTSGPYAAALTNDYPETVKATNRILFEEGLVTYADKSFYEDQIIFADANFFSFFSFPLLVGDASTVLSGANNVVISTQLAKKYFGDENPLGKVLKIDNDHSFTVSGIFGDSPNKSHLEFDMVFPMTYFDSFEWTKLWFNHAMCTYIKVNTPNEALYLEGQLPDFIDKYMGDDFKRVGTKWGVALEPLNELYFNEIQYEFTQIHHGNWTSILTLSGIALAILFIACFNYINLSIAQSYKRAKEVGIRKVLGVDQRRLIFQFMGESILIVLVSVFVSIVLSEFLRIKFNEIFDLNVIFNWQDPMVLLLFSGLFIIIILASGLYPALLLSSFHPLKVFKTGRPVLGKNILIRKGLVILQFSLSIFLIIATSLIYLQLNFIKNRDLGFNKEAVLIVERNNADIATHIKTFEDHLRSNSLIKNVTAASGEPGGFHDNAPMEVEGIPDPVNMHSVFSDLNYFETFDIPIIAGRGFDINISSDKQSAMLVNEKAVQAMGLTPEQVIGKKVHEPFRDLDRTIIGVFQDYHFQELKSEIIPLNIIAWEEDVRVIAVKVDATKLRESVQAVEEAYSQAAPNFPMSSRFLDDSIAASYHDEEKQAKIFTGFSALSIFLACMGIFGLAAFSAQQRQKELSIRKVLGASVSQVVTLLSKEFIALVGIATIIAIPISGYFIKSWLENFAYRIDVLDFWVVFLMSGVITMLTTFVTVGAKTLKTATRNPAEIIRNE